ncbi:hypothetical protein I6M34_14395 [Shewanella algae]|uniref:hypothetical protein n=1 Tax=Shewanella algae TaxID=38313 RepID=UPI001AAC974F|nr:hypothetical protein [Shewanella algae]MBO2604273.1 hypothetical protein [Shewanella algae]
MSYDRDDVQAAEALHAQLAKTPIYELLLQYAELIDKRLDAMDTVDGEVYDFFHKAWDSRDIIPMDIAIHKINEETTFETPTLTDVIIAASSSFNASSYPLFVQLHKTYNWPKSSSKTLFT